MNLGHPCSLCWVSWQNAQGGFSFPFAGLCLSPSASVSVWVLRTLALFLLGSLLFLLAGLDSELWKAYGEVIGLQAILASFAMKVVKSLKLGNSRFESKASVAFLFHLDAIQSGSLWTSFLFSSQSFSISRFFTCDIASWQAFKKSEKSRSPSASLGWTFGHSVSLSLKALCITKGWPYLWFILSQASL